VYESALHLLYNSPSKLSSSASIDGTVGKLEAAKSVTSAYQETTGLNILAEKYLR
jgi:hypothetical protein